MHMKLKLAMVIAAASVCHPITARDSHNGNKRCISHDELNDRKRALMALAESMFN